MKKQLVFILCALMMMLFITGCGAKTPVSDAMKSDADSLVKAITVKPVDLADPDSNEYCAYTPEDRELQLNVNEDAWTEQSERWAETWNFSITKDAYINGVKSFVGCEEEIGMVKTVSEISAKKDSDGNLQTVSILSCTNRNVKMIATYDANNQIQAVKFNPIYTTGENMLKACLNTVMGMGVVFSVLILISLIISLFAYIPKLQTKMEKKKEDKTESINNTIQQIIDKEEDEISDDVELVAVIAATIAAYEGTSADGFVVRSIRKSAKWQRS